MRGYGRESRSIGNKVTYLERAGGPRATNRDQPVPCNSEFGVPDQRNLWMPLRKLRTRKKFEMMSCFLAPLAVGFNFCVRVASIKSRVSAMSPNGGEGPFSDKARGRLSSSSPVVVVIVAVACGVAAAGWVSRSDCQSDMVYRALIRRVEVLLTHEA